MSRDWVALAGQERAALLGFLAAVDDEAGWGRPTACAPWTVKDVVAHLVELEVVAGRFYRGEIGELELTPEEEEAGVRRWNALPGVAVRAALWQHGRAAQGVAERLGEPEWDRPVRVLGGTKLRHLVRIQFFEIALHGHDVTDALGAAPLWGERTAAVVEIAVSTGPRTLAASGLAPEGALTLEVEGAGRWTLAGRPDGWVLAEASAAPATVTTDPETFVLVATGRCGPAEAIAGSRVAGDAALAERILAAWRIA